VYIDRALVWSSRCLKRSLDRATIFLLTNSCATKVFGEGSSGTRLVMAQIIYLVRVSSFPPNSPHLTYTKSTALSLVTGGILFISPHTIPVQPIYSLSSLLSTANIHTTSISNSIASRIVIVTAVVLRHIPVSSSISRVSDDVAHDRVDLLSAGSGVVCVTSSGGVNDWTDADFLDGSISVCGTATVS
jgi:hypothetical protein